MYYVVAWFHLTFKKKKPNQFGGLTKEKLTDSANSLCLIHLFPCSIVLQVSISLVNN